MAKRKSQLHQGRKTTGIFSPFMLELTMAVRLTPNEIRFDDLISALKGKPGTSIRADQRGVRGTLRGDRNWGAVHSHYTIEKDPDDDLCLVELEITSRRHGRFRKGVMSTSGFIRFLATHLTHPDRSYAALLGSYHSFPMREWSATVPLPFSPPGTLDHIPGLPKISGLDFSFTKPGPEQPLVRAFITTYDGIGDLIVRMLLSRPIEINTAIPNTLAEAAAEYLPKFVEEKRQND